MLNDIEKNILWKNAKINEFGSERNSERSEYLRQIILFIFSFLFMQKMIHDRNKELAHMIMEAKRSPDPQSVS